MSAASKELMHLKTWLSVYDSGQEAGSGDLMTGQNVALSGIYLLHALFARKNK